MPSRSTGWWKTGHTPRGANVRIIPRMVQPTQALNRYSTPVSGGSHMLRAGPIIGHQKAAPITSSETPCSKCTQVLVAEALHREGTCQSHMAPRPRNQVRRGRRRIAVRGLKLVCEGRRPKPEGRKKAEIRRPKPRARPLAVGSVERAPDGSPASALITGTSFDPVSAHSAFGFRPSFGLRPSGFGLAQVGKHSSTSGGTINWSSKCCSICALNRYPLARAAMGDASARNNTNTAATRKRLRPENRKRRNCA